MSARFENEIEIATTPQALFDYVTQPWRWHEWHPNSRRAQHLDRPLVVGDSFVETIAVQPLSPLPLTLERQVTYAIERAEAAQSWQVRGEFKDGWLRISYRFTPAPRGVLFQRRLDYAATGLSRCLMPLLARRMQRQSVIALNNLSTLSRWSDELEEA